MEAAQNAFAAAKVSIHALAGRATIAGLLFITGGSCFDPRPRGEGDSSLISSLVVRTLFRSTPSRGGRPSNGCPTDSGNWFRSTPSRGGRLQNRRKRSHPRGFRSTPSRGGRRAFTASYSPGSSFDPRPRGEGDLNEVISGEDRVDVSIHALAGRATCMIRRPSPCDAFRSTPSRGGRHYWARTSIFMGSFRSTPSRGGRQGECAALPAWLPVSIHALAGRATSGLGCLPDWPGCFDPRPRGEGDAWFFGLPAQAAPFRSTPSRGGRHRTPARSRMLSRFRSTPSRGGRQVSTCEGGNLTWFRSTPSRGGRHRLYRCACRDGFVSIHALAGRATEPLTVDQFTIKVSIHALAGRATVFV